MFHIKHSDAAVIHLTHILEIFRNWSTGCPIWFLIVVSLIYFRDILEFYFEIDLDYLFFHPFKILSSVLHIGFIVNRCCLQQCKRT
jgi:hypothetical protein